MTEGEEVCRWKDVVEREIVGNKNGLEVIAVVVEAGLLVVGVCVHDVAVVLVDDVDLTFCLS